MGSPDQWAVSPSLVFLSLFSFLACRPTCLSLYRCRTALLLCLAVIRYKDTKKQNKMCACARHVGGYACAHTLQLCTCNPMYDVRKHTLCARTQTNSLSNPIQQWRFSAYLSACYDSRSCPKQHLTQANASAKFSSKACLAGLMRGISPAAVARAAVRELHAREGAPLRPVCPGSGDKSGLFLFSGADKRDAFENGQTKGTGGGGGGLCVRSCGSCSFSARVALGEASYLAP